MALINCSECGKQVSDKASFCPNCGCPIRLDLQSRQEKTVKITFPVWPGQMMRNNCYVCDENGTEISRCRQGETVEFRCEGAMKIFVKMQGCFGKPSRLVNPGENYKIDFRGFGKIFITNVDYIV